MHAQNFFTDDMCWSKKWNSQSVLSVSGFQLWTVSGNSFDCHDQEVRVYFWYLVGKGQGCC